MQQVPYTNLVMLVVYTTCPCETTSVKLEPKEIRQNDTLRCVRMKQNIYRRRPNVCLNYHPEVRKFIFNTLNNSIFLNV